MHILAVANELAPTGGLERVQLEVHQGLQCRGHRTTLLYETDGAFSEAWDACTDDRVAIATTSVRLGHPARTARSAGTIGRALCRARPDVIYLHWYRHLHLVAPFARASGIPIVQHIHAPPPPSLGPLGRRLVRVPARTVAVSQHTADGWGPFRDGIGVIHNGVDLATFRPRPPEEREVVRVRWGLPPDAFVVAYSGRITPEKGVEQLIDAWKALAWDPERHRLVMVGKPWPDPDYHPTNGGAPGIEWHGFRLDRTELHAVADVVVVPSIWPDPGPLTVIEAMASGTPLVASAVGGIPELLPATADDLLVPTGDAMALADRLADLRDRSPDQRRELGALLRRHAEFEFDISRVIDRVDVELRAAALPEEP